MVISHSALAMKPCKMRSLELFCLDGARKRVAPSDSVWLRAKLASPTRRRARAGGSARRGGAASGAEAEGAEWPEAQRYRAEGAERPEAERDRVEGVERDEVEAPSPVGTLPRRTGEVAASAPTVPLRGIAGELGREGKLGGGEIGSVTWRWSVARSGEPRSRWPTARSA
jgi:hypothetical protein